MALSFETACVRVEPDGQITLLVGTHSHGQGHETTFAQLVADEFGVGIEQVIGPLRRHEPRWLRAWNLGESQPRVRQRRRHACQPRREVEDDQDRRA